MAAGKLKGKWKLITGIVVGIIVVGSAGWYFFGSKGTVQAQAATAPVAKGTIDVRVSGTGNVEPADTSNVIAKAGGNITGVSVANGQHVQKGQLLFTLDDSSVQSQIEKTRLDQRQNQTDMKTTNDQLNQQRVYAPFGGRVTSIQVTKGQDVQKGTALFTLQDINNLTFQIPFSDASSIKVGQKADVTITDLGAAGYTGTVTKVNRAAIADTNGTLVYYVTISIRNPGAVIAGMQAQASVHTDKGVIDGYNTGAMDWATSTTVRAGISGVLTQLTVDENVVVKKGQLVASVSSDSLSSQLTSQNIKLQQSRLSISDLEKQLPDYRIYAPADGIFTMTASTSNSSSGNNSNSSSSSSADISDKWQVGDEVKAGQVVGTINNSTGMVVTVPVDEVDIAKVKLGQKADITFDALPDQLFTGSVSDISDKGVITNSAATFDVKVALDKTDGVKSGMTANVEILVNHKDGALLVPIEAVQDRGGRKFVILDTAGATGGAADGTADGRRSGSGSWSGSGSGSRGSAADNSGSAADNNRSGNNSGNSSRNNSGSSANNGSRSGNTLGGRMTPVETGLYNETSIEIINGVKEGDKVVLPSVARSSTNTGNRGPFGGGMGGDRQVITGGSRPGGGGNNGR